jgi:DNA-binding CsgD family transcriptional regulator
MFFMRALGIHLNAVMYRMLAETSHRFCLEQSRLDDLRQQYSLTDREAEILTHLSYFETNTEIADALGIRENTLQKHLQNLFRKLEVSSKWEILKLF